MKEYLSLWILPSLMIALFMGAANVDYDTSQGKHRFPANPNPLSDTNKVRNGVVYDHRGNIIKDVKKGIAEVVYEDLHATFELDPATKNISKTKNVLPRKIKFIDGTELHFEYTNNDPYSATYSKCHMIFNKDTIFALMTSGDFTLRKLNDSLSIFWEYNKPYVNVSALYTHTKVKYIYTYPAGYNKTPIVKIEPPVDNKFKATITNLRSPEDQYVIRPAMEYDTIQRIYAHSDNIEYTFKTFVKRRLSNPDINSVYTRISQSQRNNSNSQIITSPSYSTDRSDLFANKNFFILDEKLVTGFDDIKMNNNGIDLFHSPRISEPDRRTIIVQSDEESNYILVKGYFYGEYTSDSDMYLYDPTGQKVFIGRTHYPSGRGISKDNSNFICIGIVIDDKGTFTGISNGRQNYTVREWNAMYEY